MVDDAVADAGLEELTSDILGPANDSPVETESQQESEQGAEGAEQPTEAQQAQPQSAPQAPTAAVPDSIQIDGKTYTREQLAAALTTREQFPHLQRKYVELLEANKAAQQQPAQQPQQGQVTTSEGVKAQIRASFDPVVQRAVAEGFIEEDLAILYPDFVANAFMMRDSLLAVAQMQSTVNAKIAQYEASIEQGQQQQLAHDTRTEIDNSMASLSGQHPALAPLADPAVREQFFGYLWDLNPQMSHLRNPDFLVSQWVAYNKGTYLGTVEQARAQQANTTAQRAASRRRAAGDALTGSRPSTMHAEPSLNPGLDELVDDFRAFRS